MFRLRRSQPPQLHHQCGQLSEIQGVHGGGGAVPLQSGQLL